MKSTSSNVKWPVKSIIAAAMLIAGLGPLVSARQTTCEQQANQMLRHKKRLKESTL